MKDKSVMRANSLEHFVYIYITYARCYAMVLQAMPNFPQGNFLSTTSGSVYFVLIYVDAIEAYDFNLS